MSEGLSGVSLQYDASPWHVPGTADTRTVRTWRHGGAGGLLGSDESDQEDDEEAHHLRQRLAKKRRVAGDMLDALAHDPATASFHTTYQMARVDDAEEFAHLDQDEALGLEEPGREGDGQEQGGEVEGARSKTRVTVVSFGDRWLWRLAVSGTVTMRVTQPINKGVGEAHTCVVGR